MIKRVCSVDMSVDDPLYNSSDHWRHVKFRQHVIAMGSSIMFVLDNTY